MIARLALLLGLFGVPTLLLALGHHLRSRNRVRRGAFWGGVIGYGAALLIAIIALHYPPVLWTSGTREFLAFYLMLSGGVLGACIGALRGARQQRFSEAGD